MKKLWLYLPKKYWSIFTFVGFRNLAESRENMPIIKPVDNRRLGERIPEIEIIFHNEVAIRVQAQIFKGRTLISTFMADPGEIGVLFTKSVPYDIFFRNGATGWELFREMESEAKIVTLQRENGQYVMTGSA